MAELVRTYFGCHNCRWNPTVQPRGIVRFLANLSFVVAMSLHLVEMVRSFQNDPALDKRTGISLLGCL